MATKKDIQVCFNPHFDSVSLWIGSFGGADSPCDISRGVFAARQGVPRILEMMDRYGIRTTWDITGHSIESFPKESELIVKYGHELGVHGYTHENPLAMSRQQEADVLDKCIELVTDLCGVKPVGYVAPWWELSPNTIDLLLERGFLYDSSLLDDIVPYQHVLEDGRPGPVELPWHWSTDDAPYLFFTISVPRPMATNEHILSIWKEEFREIHSWGAYFDLVMHPQGIGRPSRIALLREFIAFMREFDGVWFATCEQVAQAYLDQREGEAEPEAINPFIKV